MPARRSLGVGLLLVCLLGRTAHAFIGDIVLDPSNLVENAATAIRTLELVNQGAKNLAKLSNITAMAQIAALTQQLYQDVNLIVGGLIGRGDAWGALMLETPSTAAQLFDWNQRASALSGLCGREFLVAQKTFAHTTQMLGHVSELLALVQSLAGNLQGVQVLIGHTAAAQATFARLETLTSSFQQAMTGDVLIRHMNETASVRMAQERLRCWGTFCD